MEDKVERASPHTFEWQSVRTAGDETPDAVQTKRMIAMMDRASGLQPDRHAGQHGQDTWPSDDWQYTGGANSWGGMAIDVGRGLVFAATGSPAYVFYGANHASGGKNFMRDCSWSSSR
ncbi:MAG: hypothetical protein ABIZ80_14910 [Bryobacteraceae bacterium]